jgi:hypothetical protein
MAPLAAEEIGPPMMNLDRLYKILAETTVQLRKGEVFEGTPELVEQAKCGGDEPLKGGGSNGRGCRKAHR